MKNIVVAIVFFLQSILALSLLAFQNDEKTNGPVLERLEREPQEAIEVEFAADSVSDQKRQQQAVIRELASINELLELSETEINEISKSLETEVADAGKRILDFRKNSNLFFNSANLDRTLQSSLFARLGEVVPESKIEVVQEYVRDSNKLDDLHDSRCQATLIFFLDGLLTLSSDQELDLIDLLDEEWNPLWNDSTGVIIQAENGFVNSIIDQLGREKLYRIFNEDQKVVLERIGEYSLGPGTFSNEIFGEESIAKIKNNCSVAMDLRIADIESLCELDQKQVKMLSLAKKGAIREVAQNWEEAFGGEGNSPNQFGVNLDALRLTSTPLTQQCTSQNSWAKAVRKILSENQLRKYQQREEHRSSLRRQLILGHLVNSFLSDQNSLGKVTYRDFTRLQEMLSEQLDRTDNLMDASLDFFKIENPYFENSMPAAHWENVKPILESRRETLKQMETMKNMNEKQANKEDE